VGFQLIPKLHVPRLAPASRRHCFQWVLGGTAYTAAKTRRGSKTQNGRFPSKIALLSKKVCYKLSFFVWKPSATKL